jgi:multiple antibiotic resistance protein
VLFLFALTMIFGEPKSESDQREVSADENADTAPSPAVFPLAVPSLASPGAMLAIVMLTDNNTNSIAEQAVTGAVMLSVVACAFVLMLLSDPIIRLIGHAGTSVVSRVMGMILASVAANSVLSAMLNIIETGQL